MVNNEEMLKVLTMVQEGKISAEEAAKLLEALDAASDPSGQETTAEKPPKGNVSGAASAGKKATVVRVRVTDTETGKTRVNVRLPLAMMGPGMRFGRKFSPELQEINHEELMNRINAGEIGQILDVMDDEDGEHVEVFLE